MKFRLLPLAFLAALLGFGCSKKENTPATVADATGTAPAASMASTPTTTGTPAATAATPAIAPAVASSGGPRVIEITANDQMKFSLTTMEAKAGEELKVVLKNIGSLPKEAMGHNWVLLKAGTDPMAFGAASMMAKATEYIGPSVKDQVIASTPVIGPKQTAEIVFKAPPPGEYPFICSFPGHVALMRGVMTVK
jgi:azurin